ncbi:MFS transporter [Pseudomonas sp. NPDC088444]|uniref:MFS transporter n=1 Tax=Pseudomonas sp. NPDC088444 TaxID=3364456 RepID=UPI00384F6FB8
MYVFLPVWQDMFMLGYVGLSVLRSAYALTLAVLQIPAASLSARIRPTKLLVLSTVITALGWLLAGLAGSGIALGAALVVAGVGASVQHPIASGLVSRAYGKAAKRPLGLYNFAGDVGKSLLPASAAALLAYGAYRDVVMVYAGVGLCAAWGIGALLKNAGTLAEHATSQKISSTGEGRGNPLGFRALLVTAVLDSAVRMGFLTFLPFVIKAHGGSLTQTGLSLTLVFIGGAIGKFCCGWMADSWGSARTIMLTEVATAVLIVAVLVAPLTVAMLVLPLLGVVLNGTSSVLYGAVTDVVEAPGLEKAFSIFYTGTIGSGALAPVLYGYVGDHAGITVAVTVIAITAAVSFLPVTVMAARHRDLFEQPR